MAYAAEKLVNENGDKLDASDKSELESKSQAVKNAIATDNADQIKSAKEDLEKAIHAVSSKLYQQAAPQQGAPDMGGAQYAEPTDNGGNDGNVYDADFKDVD